MHADAAALRVRLALQITQAGLRAGILRVCGIVRPREHDLTRPHKGADVVDVLVRLVAVDAARQPEDLFAPSMRQSAAAISSFVSCGLRPALRRGPP